jgi:hypothetical protein
MWYQIWLEAAMQAAQGRNVMGKRVGKGGGGAPKKPATKPKAGKRQWPGEGAPFEVDPQDDGDIASPKRELDEDELKEQEERRS